MDLQVFIRLPTTVNDFTSTRYLLWDLQRQSTLRALKEEIGEKAPWLSKLNWKLFLQGSETKVALDQLPETAVFHSIRHGDTLDIHVDPPRARQLLVLCSDLFQVTSSQPLKKLWRLDGTTLTPDLLALDQARWNRNCLWSSNMMGWKIARKELSELGHQLTLMKANPSIAPILCQIMGDGAATGYNEKEFIFVVQRFHTLHGVWHTERKHWVSPPTCASFVAESWKEQETLCTDLTMQATWPHVLLHREKVDSGTGLRTRMVSLNTAQWREGQWQLFLRNAPLNKSMNTNRGEALAVPSRSSMSPPMSPPWRWTNVPFHLNLLLEEAYFYCLEEWQATNTRDDSRWKVDMRRQRMTLIPSPVSRHGGVDLDQSLNLDLSLRLRRQPGRYCNLPTASATPQLLNPTEVAISRTSIPLSSQRPYLWVPLLETLTTVASFPTTLSRMVFEYATPRWNMLGIFQRGMEYEAGVYVHELEGRHRDKWIALPSLLCPRQHLVCSDGEMMFFVHRNTNSNMGAEMDPDRLDFFINLNETPWITKPLMPFRHAQFSRFIAQAACVSVKSSCLHLLTTDPDLPLHPMAALGLSTRGENIYRLETYNWKNQEWQQLVIDSDMSDFQRSFELLSFAPRLLLFRDELWAFAKLRLARSVDQKKYPQGEYTCLALRWELSTLKRVAEKNTLLGVHAHITSIVPVVCHDRVFLFAATNKGNLGHTLEGHIFNPDCRTGCKWAALPSPSFKLLTLQDAWVRDNKICVFTNDADTGSSIWGWLHVFSPGRCVWEFAGLESFAPIPKHAIFTCCGIQSGDGWPFSPFSP